MLGTLSVLGGMVLYTTPISSLIILCLVHYLQRHLSLLAIPQIPDHVLFLIAQLIKNPPAMPETLVQLLGQEDLRRRERLPTPVFLVFPDGSAGKESAAMWET